MEFWLCLYVVASSIFLIGSLPLYLVRDEILLFLFIFTWFSFLKLKENGKNK